MPVDAKPRWQHQHLEGGNKGPEKIREAAKDRWLDRPQNDGGGIRDIAEIRCHQDIMILKTNQAPGSRTGSSLALLPQSDDHVT